MLPTPPTRRSAGPRLRRVFSLALLATLSVLAGTGTTEAAGYRHFVSTSCRYGIDYPRGWRVAQSRGVEVFSDTRAASNYAMVTIACSAPRTRATTRGLTAASFRSYHARGFRLSKVTYAAGAGIFVAAGAFSRRGVTTVEVTSLVRGRRGYVLTLLAAPHRFRRALTQYAHMLDTFRVR